MSSNSTLLLIFSLVMSFLQTLQLPQKTISVEFTFLLFVYNAIFRSIYKFFGCCIQLFDTFSDLSYSIIDFFLGSVSSLVYLPFPDFLRFPVLSIENTYYLLMLFFSSAFQLYPCSDFRIK